MTTERMTDTARWYRERLGLADEVIKAKDAEIARLREALTWREKQWADGEREIARLKAELAAQAQAVQALAAALKDLRWDAHESCSRDPAECPYCRADAALRLAGMLP